MQKAVKKRRTKAGASRVVSVSWLVVVDETPIRKKLLASYYKSEKAIERTRNEIDTFEGSDLPAYRRWEAACFGDLLSALRDTSTALQRKQEILDEVEEEMFYSGCSRVTAYRRVMAPPEETPEPADGNEWDSQSKDSQGDDPFFYEEEEHDRAPDEMPLPPGFNVKAYEAMSVSEQKKFQSEYTRMAQLFEMVTGVRPVSFGEMMSRLRAKNSGEQKQQGTQHGEDATKPPADRKTDRIKELYRTLVRQLHPDHKGGEQTPRERELWEQVQASYRLRDLDGLEALAGRVEIGIKGKASSFPFSILRRMIEDLEAALRGLRKQVRSAQKHPAWKFSKQMPNLPKMEKRMRESLSSQLRTLKFHHDSVEKILSDLAAKANKPGKSARKKSGGKRTSFDESAMGDLFSKF